MSGPDNIATAGGMAQKQEFISPQDIVAAVRLLLTGIVAWIVPEPRWPAVCDRLAAVLARLGGAARSRVARMTAIVGEHDVQPAPPDWPRAYVAATLLALVMLMRCHRRGDWRPDIRVDGGEHLEAALDAGRGAILWVAPFVFSDLMTKLGLHQAGHAVSHLSRYSHGFSDTRIGVAVLNPLRTRVEERFLADRFVMTPDGSLAALRALSRRLRQNRIVSITLGSRGRRVVEVPFLRGRLAAASGAPDLALRTRAPLLPVATTRGPDGAITVSVGAPLPVEGPPDAAIRQAALAVVLALPLAGLDAPPAGADAVISGPPCIVDGNTIQITDKRKKGECWGGIVVKLYGSIAPGLDETCKDSGGESWPCGKEAKAAMSKIIRLREIVCYHVDGEFLDNVPLATCISGRNDVDSQMIRRGMARNPPEHQRYQAEENYARKRRLGLWR